jgi:hypothetical protein
MDSKKTGFTSSEYGTNGFYLKFVSGAIGTDSSGEGNNYTLNNLANSDVMLDTPTNNYPTINSLTPYNTTISNLSQGNLHVKAVTYDSGYYGNHIATFKVPESGKWYIETRMAVQSGTGNTSWIGVMPQTAAIIPKDGTGATDGEYLTNSAFTGMTADLIATVDTIRLFNSGSAQATVTGATATSYIIALALDVDNNKVYGGYDSGSGITWLASGDPAAGSNGQSHTFTSETIIQLQVGPNSGSNSNSKQTLNFGQNGTFCGNETAGGNSDSAGEGNFFYAPPSGFKALCSKNLPTPTIKLSTEHFNTKLYTGNGATAQEISLDFNPDLVWVKSRSDSEHHSLVDRVRGDVAVNSNQNIAEYAVAAFDFNTNNTVDVPVYANDYSMNTNSDNYVMWHWKANGSGSANTDGTINTTSTSVNTTAGFSIGTYTGEGGLKTVGHGLGVVPAMIMVKCRSDAIDWCVYFGDSTDSLTLNDAAARDDNDNRWNDTAPTSSVFTVYSSNEVNDSGKTYVYYAFAEIEGFSKFGQYTGNANTNGSMVNLGFRPAFVMIKRLDANGMGWGIFDNKRSPSNEVDELLYANSSDAEADSDTLNFLSNGFKVITSGSDFINGSGGTMFYMAFAESPFKYANAR